MNGVSSKIEITFLLKERYARIQNEIAFPMQDENGYRYIICRICTCSAIKTVCKEKEKNWFVARFYIK